MGAGMLIAVISYKKKKGDFKAEYSEEFHRRVGLVLEACKNAKDFDQNEVESYFDGVYGDPDKPKHFENAIEETRAEFSVVIKEFNECLNRPDVVTLTYPERKIFLSGGMSHGDPPTDAYAIIDKFQQLPMSLLKAGGFE